MQYFLLIIVGIAAGITTGLIGASGVMIIVPGLIMLGYSAFNAIGASLFADAIASLVVAWTYYQNKNLNLKQGWWIALGSVLGAQLGSFISPHIPEVGLGNSFGIFLIATAIIFWMRGRRNVKPSDEEKNATTKKQSAIIKILRSNVVFSGFLLGIFVGIISGLLGAGGGVMILLILVFVMGYTMHEGVGTSTLIMAFTAASGAIGHAITGHLPIEAALYSAMGTVVGGRFAAKFANKVNETVLSKVVGGVFCLLGIIMLI
ncbi:MAG: sulfite exporter TauE/SafE family protein [Bacillota bacterium]|nr:sulfite exporter TauE/SafE family protein [Bacillota bacterium]